MSRQLSILSKRLPKQKLTTKDLKDYTIGLLQRQLKVSAMTNSLINSLMPALKIFHEEELISNQQKQWLVQALLQQLRLKTIQGKLVKLQQKRNEERQSRNRVQKKIQHIEKQLRKTESIKTKLIRNLPNAFSIAINGIGSYQSYQAENKAEQPFWVFKTLLVFAIGFTVSILLSQVLLFGCEKRFAPLQPDSIDILADEEEIKEDQEDEDI